MAVAKGGFCWLRWLVKKFGLSYISAPPARITVLPLPVGIEGNADSWERTAQEFLVNCLVTPLSP